MCKHLIYKYLESEISHVLAFSFNHVKNNLISLMLHQQLGLIFRVHTEVSTSFWVSLLRLCSNAEYSECLL